MSAAVSESDVRGMAGIHPRRLFVASCFGVGASATVFVAISAIMGSLKEHFVLTNEQVGWIGGAGLWGFAITMLVFGTLCDVLGMRLLLRLAVLGHIAGALLMIFADGFALLFLGALTLSMADGLVQAACNPLVATMYADRKTEMFNKFHLWFPAGIVLGGLITFALDRLAIGSWQTKLVLILLPAVTYGVLFLGQKFPATERVQSGVTFGEMFKETFFRPLFLLLVLCMMMTASLELGPMRWVPAVLESAGIPGILVLVWIYLLMAVLRQMAGPVSRRLGATGILFCSVVLGGVGLFWLSYTQTLGVAIAAGTVYAVGVAYIWPTMIGVTSERVPKGGALALAMMGGIGMLSVGMIASPMMGRVADSHVNEKLPVQQTAACLQKVVDTYPALMAEGTGKARVDIERALEAARKVLAAQAAEGSLPEMDTANALRTAATVAPGSDAGKAARELLGPAENYGGKISFRRVAVVSLVLACIFGLLYLRDRARGGYKAERIGSGTGGGAS